MGLLKVSKNGITATCTSQGCDFKGEDQPLTNFYKSKRGPNFYWSGCKTCAAKCRNRLQRQKRKDPEYNRHWKLKYKYGISLLEYKEILKNQGDKCALCEKPRLENKKDFAVDHNHVTGRIRGLLCDSCNWGLGNFKCDSGIEFLLKAIEYIKKSEKL
jgi:hypothetical protein